MLEYWRADDAPAALDGVIANYRATHPNVAIIVTEMNADGYEEKLLEALAENRGPDLFSIPNAWMRGWKAKLLPLPKELEVYIQEVNDKQQIVITKKKSPALTVREALNIYVEAAIADSILPGIPTQENQVPENQIFGLPYSADSVALYVNNALLRRAGIEKPAENWQAFAEQAGKLTTRDAQKTITQSGAAIGTSNNVRYASDILAALMMQNGAKMSDDFGYATFDRYTPETTGRPYTPGAEALIFYQGFASPTAGYSSWDSQQPLSLDAFVTGKTAMYFGFPKDAAVIRERAPGLDFSISKFPQVNASQPANAALFPIEVVSKRTSHPNEAWDFLQFAASAGHVTDFLTKTKRPTAIRGLIGGQLTDPDIAPFASQVLTARSWYKGTDYPKAQEIFSRMIMTVPDPQRPEYQRIVGEATAQINQTIVKRQ